MESNHRSPACHAGVLAAGPRDRFVEVVETGVEPAESPGPRPDRFTCLRTRPTKVAGPGIAPGSPSL